MGRSIALGLAQCGADIAVQHSPASDARVGQSEAAQITADAIRDMGRAVAVIPTDFSQSGAGRQTMREAVAALGQVDVLVICASIQIQKPFGEITQEDIALQTAVNFTSTIEMLQAALPPMIAKGWGRVLNIGSVNQTRPTTELAIYAALKAAQHNLIMTLAKRHAGTGVTLNTISPGLVATSRNAWRREDAGSWAEVQARANPMRRAGQPEEVVGAAMLLCSDASSFITGANLEATGGAHL